MPNCPKNEHFLLPDTQTFVCISGGKKCLLFGKFGVLCFLKTPVLRFALLPYYRRVITWNKKHSSKQVVPITYHWRKGFLQLLFSTLSWRRPLSYRNQSTDLQCKSMDWFLYDNGSRHERVKDLWVASFQTKYKNKSYTLSESSLHFDR